MPVNNCLFLLYFFKKGVKKMTVGKAFTQPTVKQSTCLLLLDRDELVKHLVRSGDDFCICLESSLSRNQIRELSG